VKSAPFRFNEEQHEYVDTAGRRVPHITGLLAVSGWIDDQWYTDTSCERGRAVHELVAEYDLGAVDLASYAGQYRPYLLAHAAAMQVIPHEWRHVEVPAVHPTLRFGGTPDRVGTVYNGLGVLDIKSGLQSRAHAIQTALQAILCEPELHLAPERQVRFCLYLRPDGRYRLIEHRDPANIREAHRILARHCPVFEQWENEKEA
jgi:hypothetical protein